jgi:phage terminase large subunit GpA-like protein
MSTSTLPSSANPRSTSTLSKTDQVRKAIRKGWTPPPRISVPDWADRFRVLAKEAGSTSGKWSTATVEVARGPMLAVTEPGVRTITAMVSTQLLKTAMLENITGFFAHLDPCPILLIQPKEAAAEQFSKERISPLIRVTPVLREIMGNKGKSRSSDETLLYKAFPGGFLALAGAGSPDNLARRPIRVVLFDEVDKYPITREGEPIPIAEERMATFGANSLSVRVCSPTVDEESRIQASYLDSDQRRASLACPGCNHRQFPDFHKHVVWDKNGATHLTKTARIYCEACGLGWSEGDRLQALTTVRWHQTRPFDCCDQHVLPLDLYEQRRAVSGLAAVDEVWTWTHSDRFAVYMARCPKCGDHPVSNEHAGFQAGKLFSPWPKDKPADIARKWITAQGNEEMLQVWYNTQMGLPYRKHAGKEIRVARLLERREVWAADIPDGVTVLTVGIDVQAYRLELELVGWGMDEESWSIDYHVIEGEMSDPETQKALDAYLKRIWYRADGRPFTVKAACMDSGGNHTQDVYKFCKARIGRKIWAIKGESATSGQRNPVWPVKKPNSRNKSAYRPIMLGVNAGKDSVSQRLQKDAPGPGYMHYPVTRDLGYFEQLTAERSVVKFKGTHRYRVWELRPGRANEALDCRVYSYAALQGLIHAGYRLNAEAIAIAKTIGPTVARLVEPEPVQDVVQEQAAAPEPPPTKRRSRASRLA